MNIDCDRMLINLDNSKDDYNGNLQKIMIPQVIQQIFCEILVGGRNLVNSDDIFLITNIRTNIQEDSSEFEALIHEIISLKLFNNQEIFHIDLNGEKVICNVSTYIKEYLSIVEIENKKCQKCSKLKTPVEVVYNKLIMFLEGLPTSNKSRKLIIQNILQ